VIANGGAVLQISPNLDIGGAQESLRTMATYLPRAGWPTVVCTFQDGPLRAEIEQLGVPVVILPARRHSVVALPQFLLEMRRLRRDLLRLVDAHGIQVIQTRGLRSLDFLVMTLAVGRKLQVWWTIENSVFMLRDEHLPQHKWLLRPKLAAHRTLYRLGARIVNGIIVVSEETERCFRQAVGDVGDRITVVCNAVDIERYPAAVDREKVRVELGVGPDDHMMTMVGTF
jgi:hypothetical protein